VSFKTDIASAFESPSLGWSELSEVVSDFQMFECLGNISFEQAREIQENRVKERIAKKVSDVIYLCEHPPTLTLGNRLKKENLSLSNWEDSGVLVKETNRGGLMTFHSPGQLLLYPVVSLKDRRLGVRDFMYLLLASIKSALLELGLDASFSIEPAGVWVSSKGKRKIASCGLKIEHGVTNHGFSVNLSPSLLPFRHFNACGQGMPTTSLFEVNNSKSKLDAAFVSSLCSTLSENLTTL